MCPRRSCDAQAAIGGWAACQEGRARSASGYTRSRCLHSSEKSACSFIPPDVLLVNPAWIDPATFGARRVIPVARDEPHAANTLTVGGSTLVSAADRVHAVDTTRDATLDSLA
jgi:hypothetical protein